MRALWTIAIVAVLAGPAQADDTESDFEEGLNLLSEGTRLLMRSLMEEIEPALKELSGALDDLNAYHPPEILPNGDIIIRRKIPLQVEPDLESEVEL